MSDGWKAPKDSFELQKRFFDRFGEDHYTREIDRRWRTLGKLIDTGAKIRDGRLG